MVGEKSGRNDEKKVLFHLFMLAAKKKGDGRESGCLWSSLFYFKGIMSTAAQLRSDMKSVRPRDRQVHTTVSSRDHQSLQATTTMRPATWEPTRKRRPSSRASFPESVLDDDLIYL